MHPFSDSSSHLWTPQHFRAPVGTPPVGPHPKPQRGWLTESYAAILQACGDLRDKHVLDFGFGTGELARILDLLGGSVDAADNRNALIPQLREEQPSIYWFATDLRSWRLSRNDIPYDLIVACETLAGAHFDEVIASLLSALTNGGRLVVLIRNAESTCEESQDGQDGDSGIPERELHERLNCQMATTNFRYRGIYRNPDHELQRSLCTQWMSIEPTPPLDANRQPPDRLQIVGTRLPADGE